jgi:transcriptional regulator with XRE-family HTH domain
MQYMSTHKLPTAVMPYNALVGHVIQRHRESLGKNQGEVAQALGLTQSAYSRVESGQTALTVSHLRALTNALRTTPESILSEADSLAKQLVKKGVQVPNEKPTDNDNEVKAAFLIGLGILLALLASK